MSDELIKAQCLLDETNHLAHANTKLSKVCQKLVRKIKADVHFLSRCLSKPSANLQTSMASSNIPYMSGILKVVKQSEDVTQVIYELRRYGIVVDVVCNGARTWKKVIARNPQALHLIWAGKGQYGSKDVVRKAERYLECAKQFNEFAPPEVVYVFCNGVTHEMAEVLESKGIKVEGKRVDVSEAVATQLTAVFSDSDESECEEEDTEVIVKPVQDSHSDYKKSGSTLMEDIQKMPSDEKLFLDITAMLVYVSNLCNGGCHYEFVEPVLSQQAADEKRQSALTSIVPHMTGKTLVTCQSAIDDYWGIVNIMAGDSEKQRAHELANRLSVVPDCMSARFSALAQSGQIKERSKVIFGAADMLRCEILTSNVGFIRAAAAQNIHISYIAHEPRALSEEKQLPK